MTNRNPLTHPRIPAAGESALNALCGNLSIGTNGELRFAGQDVAELAARHGTPLYLMDEDRVRDNCRTYTEAFSRLFRPGSMVLYASKANCFRRMMQVVAEEGLGADVVSPGEIWTALRAGFDPARIFFHSNNKTAADVTFAMEHGIGYFVVDHAYEIELIEAEAARRDLRQKVLLRITPGIDTHTYEAVNTGKVDSKFGSAIETGQAEAITALTLAQPHVELCGFHCHVGSMVFAEDVFERTVELMVGFLADVRAALGYTADMLDLGGGYGVRYTAEDPATDIPRKLEDVAAALRLSCALRDYPEPLLLMEPGRSISADAGLTVYQVGAVKRIPGYKNYVSVDGGMSDNPRYALYGSRYTCLLAARPAAEGELICDVVGRCCESGDVIQPNVSLPADVREGELLAVCTTGAYNYSMASNYNRIPRPPIVMLHNGTDDVAVRRETLEDLIALDV